MQRLIQDASKLTDVQKELGVTVDGSSMSFGNIVNAISVMQKKMDIAGTTSKEASSTIEGSVNSMKSAWQNLLTGIADGNQEVGPLVDNFVESVITVAKNLIPRMKEVMAGLKDVIKSVWAEVIPEIEKEAPELKPLIGAFKFIIDNGPIIISTLAGIVAGLTAFKIAGVITTLTSGFKTFFATIKAGEGIMAGLNAVMSANPFGLIALAIAGLVTAFITLWTTSEDFRNFWIGLWDNIKNIVSTAVDTVVSVFNTVVDFVKNNWQNILLLIVNPFAGAFKLLYENCDGFKKFIDNFVQNIISFLKQLPTKINEIVQNVITFFKELPYNLGLIIGEMLGLLIKFGTDAWNWVNTKIPEIINGIINFFSQLPSKIWNWLVNAFNKINEWGTNVKNKAVEIGTNFINNVINFISQLPSRIWNFLSNAISKIGEFAVNIANKGKEGAKNLYNNVINGIKELPNNVMNIGKNIVEGLWNGIKGAGSWITNKVKNFAKGILDGMKNALGIHSPSTLFRDEVGKNIALGLGEGFTDEMQNVASEMQDAIPTNFDINGSYNDINSSSGINNLSNYNSLVEAFTEALEGMKIELDDEEVGSFVKKTVENAIYT